MKKMSSVTCFRCMRLPVGEVGELCRMCQEGWESPYKHNPTKQKPLSEWTLEELIATQEDGSVPGDAMYQRHEIPVGDIDSVA